MRLCIGSVIEWRIFCDDGSLFLISERWVGEGVGWTRGQDLDELVVISVGCYETGTHDLFEPSPKCF